MHVITKEKLCTKNFKNLTATWIICKYQKTHAKGEHYCPAEEIPEWDGNGIVVYKLWLCLK